MNKEKIIYLLSVEDILTVIEDSEIRIKINQKDIPFIEEKIGDIIDWRGAIEYALFELSNSKKSKVV